MCLWIDISIWQYICVKRRSKLKYVKSHYRSVLVGEHLQSFLRIASSNFEHPLNEMLFPTKELVLLLIVDLNYQKFFGNSFLLFYNYLNNTVIICFSLYPQSPKYLLPDFLQRNFSEPTLPLKE